MASRSVQLRVLLVVLLIILSIFILTLEQWDMQRAFSSSFCAVNEEPEEILFVTVTVTVTPGPTVGTILLDDEDTFPSPIPDWETTYWCLHNPDYSDFCFYENICFDGHRTLLFLDPSMEKGEIIDLPIIERTEEPEDNYRIPSMDLSDPLPSDYFLPYLNSHTGVNALKMSPRTRQIRGAQVLDEENAYFAFQHRPELAIDPYYFIKDNIMLWEAQRQNYSFSSFIEFPSMDHAILLRPRLSDSWEKDLVLTFSHPQSTVWYWEDLADNGVTTKSPICFKQAVVIGSKPQFFSGPSEGEAFKAHLYESVDLPRPDPRGWDREPNYRPNLTIYNPQTDNKFKLHNLEQVEEILKHYDLDYEIITELPSSARLREYGELFKNTDVLISPHDIFGVNYMWLGAHVSVIEIFPYRYLNNRYEIHAKALLLNYQAIRSWIAPPAENEIMIPLREMELAIIEAFDMQAISIRHRAEQLYINSNNISFVENDWFAAASITD